MNALAPESTALSTASSPTSAPLDHLSLLTLRGPDTTTFLDAQLTRNVPGPGVATLAGYCSPKGRLIASFTMWADGGDVRLLVARDIAEPIAKRLRMYVLRSKVTIEDATAATSIMGLVAASDAPPLDPWRVRSIDGTAWIRLPDLDGRSRHLVVGGSPDERAWDAASWRRLDLESGLPTITAAVQDRFVPQMVNLEALGGVDFKKGCYPGQEIVARSQYLGKLKRRMTIARLSGDAPAPAAGADVFDGAEPVGLVVGAERGPEGVVLLVELPLALFGSSALTLAPSGPALTLQAPPYPLPDNEVFVRPKL
jgi:folate-binding protein YgfZ